MSSSLAGGFDSSTEAFPVLQDLVRGATQPPASPSLSLQQQLPTGMIPGGSAGVAGGSGTNFFDLGSSAGPIVLEPQQADFGFGLWPPDPWEALLHDNMAPTFWDETTVPEPSFDFNALLHGATRPQESAERGGGHTGTGGMPGVGGSGDMPDGDLLLHRLTSSYPVSL